jgi:hypothetical protein
MKKQLEKLYAINKQIEEGLDKEGLLKARKKLYKISDDELNIDEWSLKRTMLACISEFLEADRK